MNKFVSASLAALIAVTAVLPASSTVADARRTGRNLAIGAGVILGAAALAAAANSANARSYRRSNGFYATCRKWYRQCDRGNDYACEKYETRGCTE
ncbi:MAG: hypothetical protein IKE66_09280 [Hyphomicrobium sp.]|nr:hypothetical protein [Hyphomicrobium sp.]